MPRRTRNFDERAYAKEYYKNYYITHKDKLLEQRRRNNTKINFLTRYGMTITDEQYDLYSTYKALYNDMIRYILKDEYTKFVKKYKQPIIDTLDANFTKYMLLHIKKIE
jgi:hypothetical protein